jgi:dipeptidyl aminopeptidase/acylaminoacyl peptidase
MLGRRPRRYIANLAACAAAASTVAGMFLFGAFTYLSASKYTHPYRTAVKISPAQMGLAHEDVRLVTEDGLRLAAWYVPPRGGPTVILVHGIGTNRGEMLPLAHRLVGRDYGVFLPDLRAHGDSEGDLCTLGVNEVRDVRAAVRFLQSRPEVDAGRLGIYGGSLGAATAIMAAAELPELRAVVADSAFASVDWIVRNQFGATVSLPPWAASTVLWIGSLQTGIDPSEMAPVRRIPRISPRPILIAHGEIDGFFLVGNAHELASAARDPKEVWIVPNVGHTGAYGSDPDRYVSRVAGFFDAHLAVVSAQR